MIDTTVSVRSVNRTEQAAGTVCPSLLSFLEHSASVSFAKSGRATIRIVGERQDASSTGNRVPMVVERTVIVR